MNQSSSHSGSEREVSIPRLDAFQRRHRLLGFPLAVIYKYFDDSGAYLAALITYYAFLSIFPLLLILSTTLGLVLARDEHLRQQILTTALAQFPIIGDQLGDPRRMSGGVIGLTIGAIASLYGGIAAAQAIQYAMNTMWSIPRNSRPNPFRARGRSLLLLLTAGLAVIGTTALSIVVNSGVFGGATARVLLTLGTVVISTAIFSVVFRMAAARVLTLRQVLPGAVIAALTWQLLQAFGIVYVDQVIRHASTSNSVFAIVLGLIAFLYVASVALVLSVEVNVVRIDRLYPRSLLTPFTDAVVLTDGDKRAYAGRAQAQRNKQFQRISVRFDRDGEEVIQSLEPVEAVEAMIDHVGIRVQDLAASRTMYEAALGALDFTVVQEGDFRGDGYVLFGRGGKDDFCLHAVGTEPGKDRPTSGAHVAFRAADAAAVARWHAAAIANGATDIGSPGERTEYSGHYFAAFVLDPDGNNVEAVFHSPVPLSDAAKR